MSSKFYALLLVAVFQLTIVKGQQPIEVSEDFKRETITKIKELLAANYVFVEMAEKINANLDIQWSNGKFASITSMDSFHKAITHEIQVVSKDKHMRVTPARDRPISAAPDYFIHGFKEAKLLPGNIGYIDIRIFLQPTVASSIADSMVNIINKAQAIIIDLRNHRGGSPEMVQYLCSYFLKNGTQLTSIYRRSENRTVEFLSIDVKGAKILSTPIYILTSKKTFSAGEAFAYDMKVQQRAVLIGETTGGGANPGRPFSINKALEIFIPTGAGINPITKTSWEGKGVEPDIQTSADEALNEAIKRITSKQ